MSRRVATRKNRWLVIGGGVLLLLTATTVSAYQADSRNTGDAPLFYESPGVPAATNRVIWFVADTNADGVPTVRALGSHLIILTMS